MKKPFALFSLCVLFIAFACSKTETVTAADCSVTSADAYSKALTAWQADITNKTKCQAVVTAASAFLNCPGVTAADKKAYQDLVNSNPCK